MRSRVGVMRILGSLLISCNFLCAGCSALIAYTGEDMGKLNNKKQVHESFGTPTNVGNEDGHEFEEYYTRRKVSEPTVAGASVILGVQSLGLFELWMFPAAIIQNTWSTIFGQTLRFDYAENGDVQEVRINGTPLRLRAQLP